ncbi:MAG TPA: hypothetical protein V6C57_27725 [Coleofasciculaceae cyanobacterium]
MLDFQSQLEQIERSFELELVNAIGLDYAAELPESATPEQMDKLAPAFLKFILQSGDRGFKDGVDGFIVPPSSKNNWLYNADEDAFVGQFYDQRPNVRRVFSFKIERTGDGWESNVQAVSGVE